MSDDKKRYEGLACVRSMIDELDKTCSEIRLGWDLRYPVPPEVDAILEYREFAVAQARSGALLKMAQSISPAK